MNEADARRSERVAIIAHLRKVGSRDGANVLLDMADEIERWPDPSTDEVPPSVRADIEAAHAAARKAHAELDHYISDIRRRHRLY